MANSHESHHHIPNHENAVHDDAVINTYNISPSPPSAPKFASHPTTTTITNAVTTTTNTATTTETMSGISLRASGGCGDEDVKVKPTATMSDSAKEMLKTQPEHAFSMKDRMGSSIPMDNHHRSSFTNTHQKTNTQGYHRHEKLDKDFIQKIMKNDPSIFEKYFEKVVLKPQGGVGRGIRIVYSSDSNNNTEPIRNNVDDEIHHHHVDPDPDSVNVAHADGDGDGDGGVNVAVAEGNGDGDEAGIRSLPYKKHGPYTCPKCKQVFETSQKFAAHTSSHYKHETKDEKLKRKMAKAMRRNKKIALEIQQQQFMDNGGGEGSTLKQVKVEDQAHENNHNNNNIDAPPGFDVPLGVRKIKTEPFP